MDGVETTNWKRGGVNEVADFFKVEEFKKVWYDRKVDEKQSQDSNPP